MGAQPPKESEVAERVLVVDDDRDLRRLLKITLERDGFVVVTACDGRDALERLAETSVDAIVTDLKMPYMDGCQFVKSNRLRGGEQPVLVLTGLAADDPLVRCVRAEAHVQVAYKPPVFPELPSILRRLLAA